MDMSCVKMDGVLHHDPLYHKTPPKTPGRVGMARFKTYEKTMVDRRWPMEK